MKKLLALIISVSILISVFSFGSLSVSAGAVGTTPQNAIVLKNGEWYTRCWTNSNYDAMCYNKIVVPSRGYIIFDIEKPVDSEGEVSTYRLKLYNSSGDIVWEGDKSSEKDVFNDYYSYKIPLAKGTYYMNIDPSFYVYQYSYIYTDYCFNFKASSAWEIEKNDDFDSATTISLNKKYSGILEEDEYDYDCFKVKLKKGKKYSVSFSNYKRDTDYNFYDPNEDIKYFASKDNYDEDYDYGKESIKNKILTWSFTAQKSGYHFIKVSDCADEDIEYTVTVSSYDISGCKISLSTTSYTYNGKAKKPSVTVKDSKGKTISSKYYTVKYASGRKNVGKYKVTVTFKGNYSGSKTLYFTINPVKTKITKATPAKKKLTITVQKKSTQVTGYEIQYSTSKKFTKSTTKTKTVKSYKTTKNTLSSLKAKKTYYVRVRTYKTVGSKKYYSGWSTVKKIKTK